jgi:hypothetical protein
MQRARHYNLLRQVHEAGSGSLCRRRCRLCQEDMDEAIKGYTPDGHASARLTTSTTRWCDVGGLESVRRGLVELFEMPVRWARLLLLGISMFPSCYGFLRCAFGLQVPSTSGACSHPTSEGRSTLRPTRVWEDPHCRYSSVFEDMSRSL